MSRYRVSSIPNGDFGSMATLRHMAQLVNADLTNPDVIESAKRIVDPCGPRDTLCQVRHIRGWLAKRVRFVADPAGVEALRAPNVLLSEIVTRGFVTDDCDGAAILGAAMGKAIGLLACFVAVGLRAGGPLQHVYTSLYTGAEWYDLDVTRPPGQRPEFPRTVPFRI